MGSAGIGSGVLRVHSHLWSVGRDRVGMAQGVKWCLGGLPWRVEGVCVPLEDGAGGLRPGHWACGPGDKRCILLPTPIYPFGERWALHW